MADYPFLRKEYLKALETSGSATEMTGWQAHHVKLENKAQQTFMPLYIKTHSWGEYVFDWSWADAYQRNGLTYYPKLVTAIPFTPATGPRIMNNGAELDKKTCHEIFNHVQQIASEINASSWHLLFPDSSLLNLFNFPGLLRRTGVQFHWFNDSYENFEAFLATLVARKRKMIKRERRKILEQGIEIQLLSGSEISTKIWGFFFHVYMRTYLKRSGNKGYLTREFFQALSTSMPEQIVMAVALEKGQPIACALYFFDDNTLYGRYWGCTKEYQHLHFELCYYQGIEIAIHKKLHKFDAGAQGEHKILRGFKPVTTHSLHWIANSNFSLAIADFLKREQQQNQLYINQANKLLPYKILGP